MQLWRVLLKGISLALIIVLAGYGLHLYLSKRADDNRLKNSQPALQNASASDTQKTSLEPLPPVEQPKLEPSDIINPGEDLSGLAKKASESLWKKDYKTAAALCKQLAEKDGRAFLCVGISQFMLGDYKNAVISLEKAVGNGSDEFQCRKYLAFAYYYTHDLDKAVLNAEKALGIRKDPALEAFLARLMREKNAHRNFVAESTGHFRIEYDGYAHGGMSRTIIAMLEDAYSSVGRDLDYYPKEQITVILYTNRDFQDVTRMPGWVGGYFDKRDGKIRVPVKGAEGRESELRTVLSHEYVHAVIYSITRNCPLWVHEGMAEYYSKGSAGEMKQIIPLNHLENSLAGLTGNGIMVAYMESHSAMSYLMSRYGSQRVKDMLFSLSKGNDLNGAFTDAFHISYTEFINTWGKNQ
jgi:tetratricopeptide (TPR) repeat protein